MVTILLGSGTKFGSFNACRSGMIAPGEAGSASIRSMNFIARTLSLTMASVMRVAPSSRKLM